MPQDSHEGSFGHQRPHQEQPDEENEESSSGRRRRALGDDGTGGTRVTDLLSKHGKSSAQGGSAHRRRKPDAEESEGNQEQPPPPPQQQPQQQRAQQPQQSQPQQSQTQQPQQTQRPPAPPQAPPRQNQEPQAGAPMAPARRAAPPRAPAEQHQAPPDDSGQYTADRQPPRRPRPAGDAPQPPEYRGAPRRPNGTPPTRQPGPPAPPPGPTPPAAPPAHPRPAPGPDNTGAGEDPQATRISEALSGDGKPAPRAEPEQRPGPPAQPERTRQHPVPPPAREPVPDAEVTTQHAPVGQEDTPEQSEHGDTPEEDVSEDAEDVPGADEQPNGEYTAAIDATLARFSAVHDQIAEEEAQRRNRFAWLFRKRREPELGQDSLPFDFAVGRDSRSSRMESKQQHRKQRSVFAIKALAATAAALVFVATGVGWSAKAWVDAKFREVSALVRDGAGIQDAHLQTGDRNFLLVGSDTRAGAGAGEGVGTAKGVPGARGDTTMIAHIPADRSRIVVVSLPRDLEVDLPDCNRWDPKTGEYSSESVPEMENVKFNVAYATGGPKCTTKLVQQISGLSITNFLGIDFQGFSSMVDSVEGVRVCSKTPIIDDVLGPVIPTAGVHKLNGRQALEYVRARHVQGDPTSGYGRMERQQLFLSALLRKVMSANVLLDPGKLTNFVSAVTSNTFGENIGTDQLIALGKSLQGLKSDKVTFVTVPTTGVPNDNGNEELRESDAHSLFRAIIEGTSLAPEKSSDSKTREIAQTDSSVPASTNASSAALAAPALSQAPKPTQPSQVRVKVMNTTDQAGLAGETAQELRDVGFTVSGVGNLDTGGEGTIIRHSPSTTAAAQLLATSIPGAGLIADPSLGDALRLELGSGYEGTVHSPDTGKPDVPDNLSTVNAGKDRCGGV
ncbi:LCP family protein required for cell wall assembly [Saccharopolyspora lacisalsi]|uniref:LCP family protein required for cell wall assembly n=1 Tax=Halosaccharopolyspora lacisalsi TaxID=1000566 RepID=A0A839DZ69_9PSEU|nr:LCP family protein [Halosaccharopolyspora lacisalsi]MBA8827252.1 LCP family protein required for cell wall assembly [Halosaccharopolyspora lacisalsi]